MNKTLFLGLLSILLISCKKEKQTSFPEYILAGQISGDGILYTDRQPDDTLTYSSTKPVDINQDGVDHFTIATSFFQQPGFGYGSCIITALHSNKLAAPVSDSTCADTLRKNDTISRSLNWHQSAGILYYWYFDYQSNESMGLWSLGSETCKNKYIGVQVLVGDKIIYGWIKLDYTNNTGWNYAMIADYACTAAY